MTFVDPSTTSAGNDLGTTLDGLQTRTNSLGISAGALASAMTKAFTQATAGGKQFDDVLKSLALRLSNVAVTQAFKPVAKSIIGGVGGIFGGTIGGGGTVDPSVTARLGAVKPFAAGGVIGAPSYFPLSSGGLGLAGEAGPEAIVPLSRGSDGRLGIAMSGAGQGGNITVQIATPDPGSFRRSEAYLTGQIARAVARGQRSL
jgi:phage-related minor tail protein